MRKTIIIVSICAALLSSCASERSFDQKIADRIAEGSSACKSAGGFYGTTPGSIWGGTCYATKYGYCAKTCREMFEDLNDTWGSTQNLADHVSSQINQCMDDCNSKN